MPSVKQLATYIQSQLKSVVDVNELQQFVWLIFDYLRGYSRLDLMMKVEEELNDDEVDFIYKAVERLQGHEPLQYVLGQTTFMDLVLKVNKNVLIPRPETEELVTWILDEHPQAPSNNHFNEALNILDIGTGSGCIPITLKKNRPLARVEAWDISAGALETARGNAMLNGVDVDFEERDVLKFNDYSLVSRHIVVSNPPYVTLKEQAKMGQNVLDFEPHLALFVEDDAPLLFYRAIAKMAIECLVPGGYLYFEINEAYGQEVCSMLKELAFQQIVLRKDLSGRDRMIRAIWPVSDGDLRRGSART
jgi:release factor glutamine methyltransferase